MKRKHWLFPSLLVCLFLLEASAWQGPPDQPAPADLVLQGGSVYTMDAVRSWAQAVAIRDGRIVFVGQDRDAAPWIGSSTTLVELEGKMALPGLVDSHVHPVSGGMELALCNLNGLETRDEVFRAIGDYAAAHPDRPWILGGGWDLPLFPRANPKKEDLDRLVPDRPALLSAADGHSAWANTRALEIAGIDASTPDPPEGRIEHDPESGEPTGTLREAAIDLVRRHQPAPTPEEYREGLRRALTMANRFGITSLIEADAEEPIFEAYVETDRRGELTARVVASLHTTPAGGVEQVDDLIRQRARYESPRFRATAVKIFADGVIESHTSALLEPYLDEPGNRGPLNFDPELLKRLALRLQQEDFQIHIHAIGDRAIRVSLDALEAARRVYGARDLRHTLAHIQLFDPADIPRFRRLGVVANFQPLWAYADTYITELTEPVLGPERSRWLYPIASLLSSGAVVVGGSDWSVSSMNPLDAIEVALARRSLGEVDAPSWISEERASLKEMLAAYTINGAYLSHREETTGSLEVGKAADLVVLDANPFDVPVESIHRAKVLLTLLDGEEVYRDPSFHPEHAPAGAPIARAGAR